MLPAELVVIEREAFQRLLGSSPEASRLARLRSSLVEPAGQAAKSLLTSDRERELEQWLTERGFEDPWELAAPLAIAGWTTASLDELADTLRPDALETVYR